MANGIVLNIDTTKSEFQNPMIELRQGDGNYQSLDVTVTSNGSPFNMTGWTITFMGTTAGGFKIVDSAVSNVDTANGKFTYTPTKAWGQDEGMFKEAYFKFTSGVNGNSVASGASIRVNVLTAVDLTAEEAGDYISIVDQTIATLNEDLTTLQLSVDQLKAQNNAIKTTDNTWSGSNTFNKKIIATAGVQGPIDNTSLINAPAFQSLQTKVVGTNLLIGTATPASITGNNSGNQTKNTYSIAGGMSAYDLYQKYGSTFTLSYDWSVTDTASAYTGKMQQQFNWTPWAFGDVTNISSSNTSGHKVTTFTLSNSSDNKANSLAYLLVNVPTTSTITVSNMKLEKGNIATDWCPAPSDVPSNDAQLVHKTGTETVAGDKTFTGNTTFTQLINGYTKIIETPTNDINLIKTPGKYRLQSTYLNVPTGMPNSSIMIVEDNTEHTVIYQTVISRDVDGLPNGDVDMFIRMNLDNNWTPWRKLAQDQQVLHNTGTETATGDKTFTGVTTFSNNMTIKSGNYGLRVTTTGIQKTSDNGTTWTNI